MKILMWRIVMVLALCAVPAFQHAEARLRGGRMVEDADGGCAVPQPCWASNFADFSADLLLTFAPTVAPRCKALPGAPA
jgi:hypothetical protein